MANKTIGAELVKSISFEVEAIPQDDVVEVKNSGKMTPLNVKVRVRKKEDGPSHVRKGIISIPHYDHPEIPAERLRLASSDMTIMSFNMLMEADLEKKAAKKPKRKFFGICLGRKEEHDDDQYLPSSAIDDNEDDRTTASETGIQKLRYRKQGDADDASNFVPRVKRDRYFGKCKPGGCLDPPFGEDKYAYEPQNDSRIQSIKSPATKTITQEEVDNVDMIGPRIPDSSSKKKEASSSKIQNKDSEKNSSILSLYQGEKKTNLEENDSNSIITYPPALSSSGLLHGDERTEKGLARRTSAPRQSRKSFNEFSATYFSPPRTPRDSKDSANKERAKSYSTKDIKDEKPADSKTPRRISNSAAGVAVDQKHKSPEAFDKESQENNTVKPEVIGIATATAALAGAGVIAAIADSKKKDDTEDNKSPHHITKPITDETKPTHKDDIIRDRENEVDEKNQLLTDLDKSIVLDSLEREKSKVDAGLVTAGTAAVATALAGAGLIAAETEEKDKTGTPKSEEKQALRTEPEKDNTQDDTRTLEDEPCGEGYVKLKKKGADDIFGVSNDEYICVKAGDEKATADLRAEQEPNSQMTKDNDVRHKASDLGLEQKYVSPIMKSESTDEGIPSNQQAALKHEILPTGYDESDTKNELSSGLDSNQSKGNLANQIDESSKKLDKALESGLTDSFPVRGSEEPTKIAAAAAAAATAATAASAAALISSELESKPRDTSISPSKQHDADSVEKSSDFEIRQEDMSLKKPRDGMDEYSKGISPTRDYNTSSPRDKSPIKNYDKLDNLNSSQRDTSLIRDYDRSDVHDTLDALESSQRDRSPIRDYDRSDAYDNLDAVELSKRDRSPIRDYDRSDAYDNLDAVELSKRDRSPIRDYDRSDAYDNLDAVELSKRDRSPIRDYDRSDAYDNLDAVELSKRDRSPIQDYDRSEAYDNLESSQRDKSPVREYDHSNVYDTSDALESTQRGKSSVRDYDAYDELDALELSQRDNSPMRDSSRLDDYATSQRKAADHEDNMASQLESDRTGDGGTPQYGPNQDKDRSGDYQQWSRDVSPGREFDHADNASTPSTKKFAETRDASVASDIIKSEKDIISDYRDGKNLVKSTLEAVKIPDTVKREIQHRESDIPPESIFTDSEGKPLFKTKTPSDYQSELEEIHGYRGKYRTSQSDLSTDYDNKRGKDTEKTSSPEYFENFSSSVTVKPSGQARDSIFLNLAFQTTVDGNQTTVKTLDSDKDNDLPGVVLVKSLIKAPGKGVSVPISSKHHMNIEIRPTDYIVTDIKSKTPKSINKFDPAKSDEAGSSASFRSYMSSQPALSVVYNRELRPLHAVIKDLKNEIDMLAAQQILLKEQFEPKRVRPLNKKCACPKPTFRKNKVYPILHSNFQ